jgi:chitinase
MVFVIVVADAYPPGGELYGLARVFRYVWRLARAACTGSAVEKRKVADGKKPPGTEGSQSEHIIDVRPLR